MRRKESNLIQNQFIEIEFENLDNVIGVQDRIAEVFYDKLQPKMEELFDEIAGENYLLSLEKLEIDSGILSENNWEQEWVENTIRKLKEELIALDKKEVRSKNDSSEQATESFLFFLEKGFLPWNNRIDSIHQIEEEISLDSDFIIKLKKLCSSSVNACERLSFQFSEEFREKIITVLSAGKEDSLEIIFLLIENLKTFQIDKRIIDVGLIKNLVIDKEETAVWQFFKYIYSNVKEDEKFAVRETLKNIIIKQKKYIDGKLLEHINMPGEENETIIKEVIKVLDAKLNEAEQLEIEKKEFEKTDDNKSKDAIYVNNAGLVILHPFLPEFFEHLKLTEENNWIDIQSQHKASIIFQFLLTGEEEFPEFDLPLNKILCGIDLSDAIKQEEPLCEEIKTECENLLSHVIQHWSALKNTGIDALRQTFLQRNGKITAVDNGWLLQVEQKGVDVLLSKLPWGIGIIKLPWMEKILYVEWV